MSSHTQRAMPRGSLGTNRYVAAAKPAQCRNRREYRDWLKKSGGFSKPRLK